MSETDAVTPRRLVEMYLAHRASELADSTLDAHERRLLRFVRWCETNDIDDVAAIDGRTVHEWQTWRQENPAKTDSVSPETVRSEVLTIRVLLRFAASIDAADSDVHEHIVVPRESKRSRSVMIDADHMHRILDHIRKYRYASDQHVIMRLLWYTGVRAGTLRAFDVEDFDADDASLRVRHRPDSETPLKNGVEGERRIAVDNTTVSVLEDYVVERRKDVTDDHGREPLVSTQYGRRSRQSYRSITYYWTVPCRVTDECPHDRDPDACSWTGWDAASKCPSSESTHAVRRGAITHHLRSDVPKAVVSDRMNVSSSVLDRHYNEMTESEKMEQRREYLDGV